MKGATIQETRSVQYELEIRIDAPPERVWSALVDETNAWWLPDFHMVSPSSTVTFETRAGGGLIEHQQDGGSLLWYTVQYCQPQQHTIYLVGNIAPDWGGPTTTNLKLAVTSGDDGSSILQVTDAHHGRVDDESLRSLESGWKQLFSDGLKEFVENGVRRDQ